MLKEDQRRGLQGLAKMYLKSYIYKKILIGEEHNGKGCY
jgi:hypothetical protein